MCKLLKLFRKLSKFLLRYINFLVSLFRYKQPSNNMQNVCIVCITNTWFDQHALFDIQETRHTAHGYLRSGKNAGQTTRQTSWSSATWCAENEAGVSHTTASAAVTPPSPLFVDCGGGSQTESDRDTSRQKIAGLFE